MPEIFVDNKACQVREGLNLLEACLELGLNLPYFCWHPAMGSVGACRQCAVKQFRDENDTQGRLVMACMTPAAAGTRISIDDAEARQFRATVIEGLMLNHPHDCPVCDEGGECHLQDMTVMTGHDERRYAGLKRTFENQNLGPLVNHEMNRCIQCYRCTRFYNDYAGGHDFGPFVLRNLVFFGRAQDGVLESEFSGNLVEVCPTGVFTDKTLKQHYTRKWDLTTAPSLCVHCSLGCNTIAGERYGGLRRIRNRYNGEVNGYFLCDRGRYGYEFVNSERRIRTPRARREDREGVIPEDEAVRTVASLLDSGKVIGIGSPRASLETNFALRKLVGAENFFDGVNEEEHRLTSQIAAILKDHPAKSPSMKEVRESDAVFILGEDVTNSAPMLDLSIRQAVRNMPMKGIGKIPAWDDKAVRELLQDARGPLFIASPRSTKLDEISTASHRGSPPDLARLGFAVAHALDPKAPAVRRIPEETGSLARRIAEALLSSEHPLVLSGTGSGSVRVIEAAANIARALCRRGKAARLCYTLPEANSLGLALLGGKSLDAALRGLGSGTVATVIIAENDLYRRAAAAKLDVLFPHAINVVVIDHLENPTTRRADILLPAATFAESNGTLINNEGRAQRFFQVFPPEGAMHASWEWIGKISEAATADNPWKSYDDIVAEMATSDPLFRPLSDVAPAAGYRVAGQKIAREPHRYSGRTAMAAQIDVSEPKPADDPETPFSFTMEGFQEEPHPSLIPRYWIPGWNSVQALNRFQEEIGGPLRGGDPGERLLEPNTDSESGYFSELPDGTERNAGELLLVHLHHIFGSEELSMHTPGIAELAVKPSIALHPEDAARLKIREGDHLEIVIGAESFIAPATLDAGLAIGVAGVPAGLPGFQTATAAGKSGHVRKMR